LIVLSQPLIFYVNGKTLEIVTIDNFDKIVRNKIIKPILLKQNDNYIYKCIDNTVEMSIGNPITHIKIVEPDLTNINITETVDDRINNINKEIDKIVDIRKLIYDEKIYDNLNNKEKHMNPNNKHFISSSPESCSIIYVQYSIFKNEDTYNKTIDFMNGLGLPIEKIGKSRLVKIFNNIAKKNIHRNKYVRKITNMFLLGDIITSLDSYRIYLDICIENLRNNLNAMHPDIVANNISENYIYINETVTGGRFDKIIQVKNRYIDGAIKTGFKYKLPTHYQLCHDKQSTKWNIMYKAGDITTDLNTLNRYYDFIIFKNMLYR